MKLYVALQILSAASIQKKFVSSQTSTQTFEGAVGDGCENSINFHSSFSRDIGDAVASCQFCKGSHLSSLFNPKIDSTCIDFSSGKDACDSLTVITSFQKSWVMEFISFTSSSMDPQYDPAKIVLQGSTDSATWNKLYDSSDEDAELFPKRNQNNDIVLNNNNKEYKHYMMTFSRKDTTSKMYLGGYGIVQSYTKQCTSKFYNDITGNYIAPYKTPAPTDKPTAAPTGIAFSTNTLKSAVKHWITNRPLALATYGHIREWNTGEVTSMKELFEKRFTFNDDISMWNTGSVTDMEQMFYQARVFNVDISGWNLSIVNNIRYMFYDARLFNVDLTKWDVGVVTKMDYMFANTRVFNGDISGWNVENVNLMTGMFSESQTFNSDISKWNVGNVVSMNSMFKRTPFNIDISEWNVSRVTSFQSMFFQATSFNVNLAPWDVSKVVQMSTMFNGASSFDQNLCWTIESNVNVQNMFVGSNGSTDC